MLCKPGWELALGASPFGKGGERQTSCRAASLWDLAEDCGLQATDPLAGCPKWSPMTGLLLEAAYVELYLPGAELLWSEDQGDPG